MRARQLIEYIYRYKLYRHQRFIRSEQKEKHNCQPQIVANEAAAARARFAMPEAIGGDEANAQERANCRKQNLETETYLISHASY